MDYDFENWIAKGIRPRWPELEQPIRSALAAFDQIQAGGKCTPDLLAPIVEAASGKPTRLYEFGTKRLARLTAEFPEARTAVQQLAASKQAHLRYCAVLSIGPDTPEPFAIELLTQLLRDRSSTVRQKSADWALRHRLRGLVPELESCIRKETHAATKKTMNLSLHLLRDGFLLRPCETGGKRVTCLNGKTGFKSIYVSDEKLAAEGVEAIIAGSRKYPHFDY